jgi:hypothetical protein
MYLDHFLKMKLIRHKMLVAVIDKISWVISSLRKIKKEINYFQNIIDEIFLINIYLSHEKKNSH